MTKLAGKVLDDAKRLSPDERIWLAEELLRSVDPASRQIDVAWAEEAERRIAALDAGLTTARPAEEALRYVRGQLGCHHP